jgi:hypothetical protein
MKKYLADEDWLWIGHTEEHYHLKCDIADVCRDVTEAGCIDEICINDILQTFRKFGYEVIKKDD